jgi:colanic acid/amylovoran biosynthesis glycosyltransferase
MPARKDSHSPPGGGARAHSLHTFTPLYWDGQGTLRVLIAASSREKKGLPYALQALVALAKKLAIEGTIIGDAGPTEVEQAEKRLILRMVEQHRSDLNPHLLGYQQHDALMKEATRHHVFISPSVTASDGDTEGGAPVTIIEMLASGMPVVSSLHADIPEVRSANGPPLGTRERRTGPGCEIGVAGR